MKEKVLGFSIALFYLTIITVYFTGIVHTYQKHDKTEALISIGAFPWAIYRGIEFWWHDDFADVDWKKRIPNDAMQGIALLQTSAKQDGNAYQLEKDLEEFSERINGYPKDRKNQLRGILINYVKYELSIADDLIHALRVLQKTSYWNFEFSSKTIRLEKSIFFDGLGASIEPLKERRLQLLKLMDSQKLNKLTQNEKIEVLKQTEFIFQFQKSSYDKALSTIFEQ